MSAQKIHLLDEQTINQIAAGEVIENSASVVKELLENALDASASMVKVETKGGGRGLIRMIDDGCGMREDDLVLSLERHATSKLSDIEDLNSLMTLGFRGEALSSIAAVSKLSIHTAISDDEGRQLLSEGGKILKLGTLPRCRGTTIEVKGLFFNVPARRKFQKSVGWDTAEIHKVLTKMALCYQNVGFSWVSDDMPQFSILPEASLKERIETLLGTAFGKSLIPVEHHDSSLSLTGFCGNPAAHRPNRTGQYLFMNGRAVVSPFVSRKVLEGYGTRLSTHRYPLFVLHLSLPPSEIDVNVHPQKKEVRLRNEHLLGPFLTEAIEKSFASQKVHVHGVSSFDNEPQKRPTFSFPQLSVSEPTTPYTPTFLGEEEKPSQLLSIPRRVVAKTGNYLFVEDDEGVRVVDGASARMRVAYEQLVGEKTRAIQHLLLPIQIEVTGAEKVLLMEVLPVFEEAGISIRHFGENTFVVDAIPSLFEGEEVAAFVHAFLDEGQLPKEKKIARALRKTLKLNSRTEGEVLVEQLFQCQEYDYTPEGKPTHILLTDKELGHLFK